MADRKFQIKENPLIDVVMLRVVKETTCAPTKDQIKTWNILQSIPAQWEPVRLSCSLRDPTPLPRVVTEDWQVY